jgi:putative DNA primase/helicase
MTDSILPQVATNGTTQTPRTLVDADAIPHELQRYKQFVDWRYQDNGKPKLDKIPVNPRTLGNAGSTWPNTWSGKDAAVNTYQAHDFLAGIGLVLTPNDPYTMGDLDNCIINGKFSTLAIDVIAALNTYVERSPSKRGIRFLVHCRHQPDAIKRPEIELYSKERFATLTGDVLMNAPIAKVDSLDWFIDEFVPKPEPTAKSDPQLSSFGADRLLPSGDDAELWNYIFRVNPLAEPIFNGDLSNVRGADQSRAVMLLLNSLALWTKGDAARMESMIRQTYLDKSKWDENRKGWTWLYGRIQDAIGYMAGRGR